MKLTQDQRNKINYLYGYVLDNDIATDAICQLLNIIHVQHKRIYKNDIHFISFIDSSINDEIDCCSYDKYKWENSAK